MYTGTRKMLMVVGHGFITIYDTSQGNMDHDSRHELHLLLSLTQTFGQACKRIIAMWSSSRQLACFTSSNKGLETRSTQAFKEKPFERRSSGYFFGFLPRGAPIPPSGPSKQHNSIGFQSHNSP